MSHNINDTQGRILPLPITQMAINTAKKFASGQPTPKKTEQVHLNTLAVCAVNDYLQMLGIPTNLSVSDICNPVVRMCADVADLEINGIGRLECRPVTNHQQICYFPPEVHSDRIGYIAVEIDETSGEATLLGFTQTLTLDEFPIKQLKPIEDFIDHYHQLLQLATATVPDLVDSTRVNLSQWFQEVFETSWQAVETLLNPDQTALAFSFRSPERGAVIEPQLFTADVRRARLIDLGMQLAGNPLALIVELNSATNQKTDITIQVHPTGNQIYLPPLVQLTVLDESDSIFLEAQSRSADNYIQLQFSGLPGELFSVRVTLGDANIVEYFAI
ncbi:MAG: DUF1822 family protein [Symploca sp. SIO2E9]|nr:DUF1822 family protein [Symploca sp. SIO2E9]